MFYYIYGLYFIGYIEYALDIEKKRGKNLNRSKKNRKTLLRIEKKIPLFFIHKKKSHSAFFLIRITNCCILIL